MASEKKKVVRRIKASTGQPSSTSERKVAVAKAVRESMAKPTETDETVANDDARQAVKSTKKQVKEKKASPKKTSNSKSTKTFILFRPFVAFGHYLRDSWRELRKVEWPSRRATWKMTLGVVVFCVFIGVFVLLCDWISQWLIQEVVL